MEIEVYVDERYYPCFTIDGTAYHITLGAEVMHVTEDLARTHYYFKTTILAGQPAIIEDAFLRDNRGRVVNAPKFSQLPANVQTFIRRYYMDILRIERGQAQIFIL